MKRSMLTLALASFSCIAGGAAGAAYAGIPDADGIIHACFKSSSTNQGSLRVIDTAKGQTCGGGESPLQWRQSSPEVPKVSASQTSGSGIIVAPGYSESATVSITAPAAGHVLVTGWATAFGLAADQFAFARLRDTASGVESHAQGARVAAGDSAVLSVGWMFEVEAGEQVFALETKGVVGTINIGSATIIAVFLPD